MSCDSIRDMRKWSSEELFLDNDEFYVSLLKDIDEAKESIDMEVFTFEEGTLARRLCAAFARATARGVRVRLICDGWGSPSFWNNIGPDLRKAGVRIRVYRPLPWRIVKTRGEPRGVIQKIWSRVRKINRGFHRKITFIDNQIAWISSLNVSDLHLKEVYGKNAWADIGARFIGEELSILKHAFEKAFYRRRWLKYVRRPRPKLLFLNDSFMRRRQTMNTQKRRLSWAKHRIWIQNPYFIPERKLLRALYIAARKGVDVRIILPEKSDQPLIRWMSYSIIRKLVRNGVKVFEYLPRFAHKKVLIVDQTYTIGSTNFNHRSVLHDLEVEVLVTHPSNQSQIEKTFVHDQTESAELTMAVLEKHSLFFKAFTRILFFFRYWC